MALHGTSWAISWRRSPILVVKCSVLEDRHMPYPKDSNSWSNHNATTYHNHWSSALGTLEIYIRTQRIYKIDIIQSLSCRLWSHRAALPLVRQQKRQCREWKSRFVWSQCNGLYLKFPYMRISTLITEGSIPRLEPAPSWCGHNSLVASAWGRLDAIKIYIRFNPTSEVTSWFKHSKSLNYGHTIKDGPLAEIYNHVR